MRCLKSPELTAEEFDYAVDICNTKNGIILALFNSKSYQKTHNFHDVIISLIFLVYYVPPDEGIPWPTHERRRRELGYYHWVNYIQ